MTAATVWPWAADASPVLMPQGTVVAVAALAAPDLAHGPAVHDLLARHMSPMGAAVLAELGLYAQPISGAMPGMTIFGDRDAAVATLRRLVGPAPAGSVVVHADGFTAADALAALTGWGETAPLAGAIVIAGTIRVAQRARTLS